MSLVPASLCLDCTRVRPSRNILPNVSLSHKLADIDKLQNCKGTADQPLRNALAHRPGNAAQFLSCGCCPAGAAGTGRDLQCPAHPQKRGSQAACRFAALQGPPMQQQSVLCDHTHMMDGGIAFQATCTKEAQPHQVQRDGGHDVVIKIMSAAHTGRH